MGLDTHDYGLLWEPMKANMVFTVEPGIYIPDEGIGIRPEDRDQIFNPFFGTFLSLHHSSGDFGFEQRGIGLGLAIVKRFAEMHGGTVEFDSEVGVGTEFRVVIPVHPQGTYVSGEFPAI